MTLRKFLYLSQRTLGDVDAAKRGRLGRRIARRVITRQLLRGVR